MNSTAKNKKRMDQSEEMRCEHTATDPLGWNKDVLFLRCRGCGGVLVQQGNLTVFVPRTPQSDPASEST
jgi:hypothetical protein